MSGKPGTSDKSKTSIYARFDPDTLKALDKIGMDYTPKPSRAQLIRTAVDEFVARHVLSKA